ncbi:hypothetical protein HDU83_000721 [Entophlyctis luteolus]|nr:hypothetical protein HDU83_000721 [Entophlyctis luteolus]
MSCGPEAQLVVHYMTWIVPITFVASNLIVLPASVYMITVLEPREVKQTPRVSRLLVPTNGLFISVWIFGAFYFTFSGMFYYYYEAEMWMSAVSWAFMAGAEVSFVSSKNAPNFLLFHEQIIMATIKQAWFSWKRSETILRPKSDMGAVILKRLLNALPAICLTPVLQICIPNSTDKETRRLITLILILIGGTPVVLLDVYFAYTFYYYTRNMETILCEVNPKLQVIARYGFASSVCGLMIVNFVAIAVVSFLLDPTLTGCSWITYHIAWILTDCAMYAIGVILLIMKVSLFRVTKSTNTLPTSIANLASHGLSMNTVAPEASPFTLFVRKIVPNGAKI